MHYPKVSKAMRASSLFAPKAQFLPPTSVQPLGQLRGLGGREPAMKQKSNSQLLLPVHDGGEPGGVGHGRGRPRGRVPAECTHIGT